MKRKKSLIAFLVVFTVFVCYFVFWFEREWMNGVSLNPYRVDEIQIVKRDGDLLREEIISIHDRAWIRDILSNMKKLSLISESNPPDYELLKGETVYIIVNDGQSTKVSAQIYLGEYDGDSQREARMLLFDRYIYTVPEALLYEIVLDLDEYKKRSQQVNIVLDSWKPLVMIDGQPYYAHFMGDGWGKEVNFQKAFAVIAQLPDHITYEDEKDITGLLTEKAGTYQAGTMIYTAEGYYFVQNAKEQDTWSVLLPYGQSAHASTSDQTGDVQFWYSYHAKYFLVRASDGYDVFSAYDPSNPNCILRWDEDLEHFVSPCSTVTYKKNGMPTKTGVTALTKLNSFQWDGSIFFEY
ncbi:MAG: hypothetical protein ACQEXQ_26500 [Bacillota bacterium]